MIRPKVIQKVSFQRLYIYMSLLTNQACNWMSNLFLVPSNYTINHHAFPEEIKVRNTCKMVTVARLLTQCTDFDLIGKWWIECELAWCMVRPCICCAGLNRRLTALCFWNHIEAQPRVIHWSWTPSTKHDYIPSRNALLLIRDNLVKDPYETQNARKLYLTHACT